MEKTERRGRPIEAPVVVLDKFERTFYEFNNEKYQNEGYKSTWYYDVNKAQNGPYKTEVTYPKGYKLDKVKPEKKKPYSKQPVVMVFKTSNRSNAKTKMKTWNNENIDYIMTAPELPGVPTDAIILELAVGEGFIELFNQKYFS
jgi:hypothetical protein